MAKPIVKRTSAMKHPVAASLVLAGVLGVIGVRAQTPPPVSYDTVMKQDVAARQAQFARLSADDKVALLREQLSRWRRHHADQLTPDQERLLADIAAFIRPDFFESSM